MASPLPAVPPVRIRTAVPALLALLVAVSCRDTSGPGNPFVITPDTSTVFIGGSRQFTAVGAPGAVQWTSSNEAVASVVAQTGFARAHGRGEAEITATSGSHVASATLVVLAPSSLSVSNSLLTFEHVIGQASPASQAVTITNAGDGAVDNLVVGPIVYGANEPDGWLTATASGSSLPVTVTLVAAPAGLRGTYTAIVPFIADGVANSPQHVAVTFHVRAPAAIAVTRTTVPMSGIPGVTLNETVDVSNSGDLPLTGLTTAVTYGAGQPQGWLAATLGSTSAPATLTLAGNTTGLAAGSYSASVRISAPGVAPVDIAVPLTVSAGPAIQLSSSTLAVSTSFNTNAAQRTVNITNSGGGTLSGLNVGAITYGAGQPTGWVSGSLNTTTAPATLTLSFATAALASGTYTATVRVQSPVASNSPASVVINLTIGPAPIIAVNPGNVTFATWGGAALPSAQVVQVTNSGGGTLSGLSASIQYTSGSAGWLAATFVGGTTAPTSLSLRPNTTALSAGTRTATVTVASTVPGVASRTIAVTYTIQTFTTNVFPFFQSAGCSGCHNVRAPFITGATTAQQYHTNLGPYVIAGNAAGSPLVCRIFGACTHTGGKYTGTAGFQTAVTNWINAGAPFQ